MMPKKISFIAALLLPLGAHATDPGDAAHGRKLFLQCAACHSVDQGAANKVGPNLYGIAGAKAASLRTDFSYSDALQRSGLTWTDENLDKWLTHPTALVPGTKMAFIGLPKDQDRADIIAYLKTMQP